MLLSIIIFFMIQDLATWVVVTIKYYNSESNNVWVKNLILLLQGGFSVTDWRLGIIAGM